MNTTTATLILNADELRQCLLVTLASAATVEVLPVEVVECDHGKWRVQAGGRWFDADSAGLDLVGGVGRYFVAVVTP